MVRRRHSTVAQVIGSCDSHVINMHIHNDTDKCLEWSCDKTGFESLSCDYHMLAHSTN